MTKKTSSLRSINGLRSMNGLRSLRLFAGLSPFAVVLAIGIVMPACEGFVCSQERIKAIEHHNRCPQSGRENRNDTD
jgi:hypothetical protein